MNALSALDVLRMKTDKAPLENAVVLFADYELEARQDGRNIIASLAAAELAAKDAELAALKQERDELKQAAVLAMCAVEEVSFTTLKEHMAALDSYLANGLSEKLWEEINASALERVK